MNVVSASSDCSSRPFSVVTSSENLSRNTSVKWRWVVGILLVLLSFSLFAASAPIDRFESGSLTGWSVQASLAQGSSGSIAKTQGPDGSGALELAYAFRCTVVGSTCNEYVAAALTLSPQLVAQRGLSFVARSSPDVSLFVRVIDASGQTLQYRVRRPADGFDPAAWYPTSVDFLAPASYWGGAANGVIQGQIKAVWVLVTSTAGRAVSGKVAIDELVHLSEMPAPWQPIYQNGLAPIDSFDNRAFLEPWQVARSSGSGVTGNLSLVAGHASLRGLSIEYQFSCANGGSSCGQYVMAQLSLSEYLPIGDGGIRFMMKSSQEVTVGIRVTDESGQVLQYAAARPVESFDPSYWVEANVPLSQPISYWGGAANGRIQGRIKTLAFVVEPRTSRTVNGAVTIDSIAMRSTLPAPHAIAYQNGSYLLDSFETRSIVEPWLVNVSSGSGVVGGLSSAAGHSTTRGLGLAYSFTCTTAGSNCGQYVMARLPLEVPLLPGKGLSLATRSPADIQLSLRVTDSGGQTLQYRLVRPLEGYDGVTWYVSSVDLSKPKDYWGGANNGVIQGRVKEIALVAESTVGRAISGTVSVDTVTMLQELSTAGAALEYTDGRATLDDLELANLPGWSVYRPSVTGMTASVSAVAGHASPQALGLNYSFSCATAGSNCGQYAAATFTLSQALAPGVGIAFMTRSSPEVKLFARVIDESGQTLQYRVARPLEGFDPARWYQAAIELSKPASYWGGANNGVIKGRIKAIWIGAESWVGRAISGTVAVDKLVMLSVMPPAHTLGYADGRAMLDAFDNRSVTEPWEFAKSSVAGASGSLRAVAGHSTVRGLGLAYSFTCTTAGSNCGQYVMARLPLEVPLLPGKGLSLATRSPADIQLSLRVTDSGGQTLQYRLVRPLEGYDGVTWYVSSVDLSKPKDYWGGANNGVIQGRVKEVSLVAESTVGHAISGAVSIDAVTMLESAPAPAVTNLDQGALSLDDFDNRSVVSPWAVESGNELVTSTLSMDTGYAGTRGMALNYQFRCADSGKCADYSMARLSFSAPVESGGRMTVRLKHAGNVRAKLRVRDETGQILQYPLTRTIEVRSADEWFLARADLGAPESYWGGVASGKPSGNITAVWILAVNNLSFADQGKLLIDELRMYRSADADYALAPLNTVVSPPAASASSLNGRIGVNIRNYSDASALDAAVEAGVGFVRVDLFWESVERNGVLDFTAYESALSMAEVRGLGTLFIVDYGHPDYDVLSPAGRAAFARFAEGAARKFAGRNVRFEVWNEPDHPGFWPEAPNATNYMTLFRETMSGLRRGDPAAKVGTGGLASFNFSYLDGMLLAGAGGADAIGMHAYRSSDPETLVESLAITNWLTNKRIQRSLPIWITEAGYSNLQIPGHAGEDEFLRTQAMLLSRQMLTYWALDVPVGVWFSLTDKGEDQFQRDHNFGLLRLDYSRKPTFFAARTFHEVLSSATFSGFVKDVPAGLHVMQFDTADERIFVAWHEPVLGSSSLSIPTDSFIDAVDFLGEAVFSESASGGRMVFRLQESDGPTYLRFRK